VGVKLGLKVSMHASGSPFVVIGDSTVHPAWPIQLHIIYVFIDVIALEVPIKVDVITLTNTKLN
jgi:hypothetical protein